MYILTLSPSFLTKLEDVKKLCWKGCRLGLFHCGFEGVGGCSLSSARAPTKARELLRARRSILKLPEDQYGRELFPFGPCHSKAKPGVPAFGTSPRTLAPSRPASSGQPPPPPFSRGRATGDFRPASGEAPPSQRPSTLSIKGRGAETKENYCHSKSTFTAAPVA